MKILAAKVDWMKGWANRPRLIVEVDVWPRTEEFVHKKIVVSGQALYYAHLPNGAVHFCTHSDSDRNDDGFGGMTFDLRLEDGTIEKVRGPWSSRSGVMNQFFQPECMEVTVRERSTGYNLGCSMTIDAAKEAAKMAGVELRRVDSHGEPVWEILGKSSEEHKKLVDAYDAGFAFTSHWEKNTVEAVNNILKGLSSSDFVTMCGAHAMKELIEYRLDMAISIWEGWFDRPPTEVEKIEMREALDRNWLNY